MPAPIHSGVETNIYFNTDENKTEEVVVTSNNTFLLKITSIYNCTIKVDNNIVTIPAYADALTIYPSANDWSVVCYNADSIN